jgi:16S rRNA (cytosine967-C5)-methyltransferase
LGAYQLHHLDRVPVHAIVHQSVELTRQVERPQAAAFVNAVLRSLLRDQKTPRLPARPSPGAPKPALVEYLSTTLSHPAWLVSRWIDRHGFDAAEAWCRFNNATPDTTVRPCGALTTEALRDALLAAGVDAAPAPFVPEALRLPSGSASRIVPGLRDQMLIQDEASQVVGHVVNATPGDHVLDLCASPGGKTVVIAADLREPVEGRAPGLLVACDRRPGRMALLRSTLARAHVRASIVALDATRALPFQPVFDRVLVDAPCSGLGTLRRDPDLKWSRREDQLASFATMQLTMLVRAAASLCPGGSLVYATCSSEPEENDEVVDRFLSSDARFTLVPASVSRLTGGAVLVDSRGFLRTLPFAHGLDAFFAAVLVRRQDA